MNTKLKCLLLDDELPGLTYLKMLCEQIPELEVVKAYNDPVKLLNDLNNQDIDLYILDIEMPGISGIQVAQLLQGKLVIFTTAYKEFAVEAFELNAVDYITKPIKKERLQQAVNKAIDRFCKKDSVKQFITLQTDKGKSLLFPDQIALVKNSDIDSRDKLVYLEDGHQLLLKNITFQKLIDLLPESLFCRINKKEIVNIHFVRYFSFDEVTLSLTGKDGKNMRVAVSDVYRESFMLKVSN